MSRRRRHAVRVASGPAVLALVLALLAFAQTASARDFTATSFDGTEISAHFFPAAGLPSGGKAPTVLIGPGWSMSGDTDPDSANNPVLANFGGTAIGAFVHHGYNVVTWDPRGFGESGGTVEVDDYRVEGKDTQALIDYVNDQPEAQHDGLNDPLLGMAGSSYGGIIQLVTAAIDDRVDVIVPNITPHDYTSSLFKERAVKAGWGVVLVGAGVEGSVVPGLIGFPPQTGNLDSHITNSVADGAINHVSDENYNWFADKGPGFLVDDIHIPVLLTQGTADTLFTLQEAINNFEDLAAHSGAPLKMMWFCGGHGVCLNNPGPTDYLQTRTLQWLDRYLKSDTTVDTGPRFEWLAEDGVWRSAADYPLASDGVLQATGSGLLPVSSTQTTGGLIAATPAPPGVGTELTIPGPSSTADVVGVPQLTLTYSGIGATPVPTPTDRVIVYAQLVNNGTHLVEGNQATPIPLTLDGDEHTISRPLEPIASRVAAGQSFTLQLVPSTNLYGAQTGAGLASLSQIHAELPISNAAATPGPGSGGGGTGTQATIRRGKCSKAKAARKKRHKRKRRCGKRKHSHSH